MYYLLIFLGFMQVSANDFALQRIAEVEEISQVKTLSMDDSYLVVLALTTPFIHIINREFVPVAQWGTRGQGPGELT